MSSPFNLVLECWPRDYIQARPLTVDASEPEKERRTINARGCLAFACEHIFTGGINKALLYRGSQCPDHLHQAGLTTVGAPNPSDLSALESLRYARVSLGTLKRAIKQHR